MTKGRINVELEGALAAIWRWGEESAVPSGADLALIENGQECYLMFTNSSWGRGDGDLLPQEIGDATAELIAYYELYQEAIAEFKPGPNDHPFATYRSARPATWTPTNPSLYKIDGAGFDELKKRLLKNAYTSIAAVRLEKGAKAVLEQKVFEAWRINSRRGFFEVRGITEGDYYCSCVNREVIDVLSGIDVRMEQAIAISSDTSIVWESNQLVYRVELDAFVLEIYLKAEASSAEQEFRATRNLLNFFFGAVHEIDGRNQMFIEFFSRYLKVEPELLYRWFEHEEWAELFLGDLERNLAGKSADWVRPDYITIRVQTSEFDPSYGALVDGPIVTFMESFNNWGKTDFDNVAIEPYLARLRGQAIQRSTRPQI
jgi:hypothetical protein